MDLLFSANSISSPLRQIDSFPRIGYFFLRIQYKSKKNRSVISKEEKRVT